MDVTVDRYAWIPKSGYTAEQWEAIKSHLTVVPRKVGDFPGEAPAPLHLWEEGDSTIGVARAYFLQNKKPTHNITYRYEHGTMMDEDFPEFSGTLRPQQAEALTEVYARFQKVDCSGGIVQAVPGWGKSAWSCALIAKMQVPALVLVHKEFLMSQWRQRLAEFLPDARVGTVQQDECDFEDKHVVLAMVHSLVTARRYPDDLYRHFGMLITDEAHRIGAQTWSVVPSQFAARWRVGLTATPRRKDRADNVFWFHIGRRLYTSTVQQLPVKVKRVWSNFRLVKTDSFNPAMAPRSLILQFLVACRPRNNRIAQEIVKAAGAGRKVLVLSERLKHLDRLDHAFREKLREESEDPVPEVGYYVGGMGEEDRAESAQAQVIFATMQFVSEGLDIPTLDTLILASPMSDIEQAVGRIQRAVEGKKTPIVVDIRDDNIVAFKKAGESRDRLYRKVAKAPPT